MITIYCLGVSFLASIAGATFSINEAINIDRIGLSPSGWYAGVAFFGLMAIATAIWIAAMLIINTIKQSDS